MTEINRDITLEGLLNLWEEINENPRLARGSFAHDVWERIKELDRKETKEKLNELRKELNTYLPE